MFSETYHEPKGGAKPKTAPKEKGQNSAAGKDRRNQSDRKPGARNQTGAAPAAQGGAREKAPAQSQNQPGQGAPAAQGGEQKPASRVPQKKVVNTRSSVDVNLDRYDAHLDELTPDSVEKMEHGKQKINSRRNQQQRSGKQSAKRRQEEQAQKMRRLQQEAARKAPVKVQIPDEITVGELASRMKKTGAVVVKNLMKMGVMASMSDVIDYDTAALVAMELGCKVEKEVVVTIEEKLIDTAEDREEDLVSRPPVIVVMGHVDHGKTSLLDKIRSSNVTAGEPGANPENIKQQLTKYELGPEEWGGETIVCPISAKTGEGIDELLEMVLLTAEMRELKANPNRSAMGAVIEARLDKGRGPIATLLVQNGTLNQGDIIIAGTAVGRVRAMVDYRGKRLKTAGPSVPVEITGMGEVPGAGDDFYAVADERMARELAEQRKQEKKDALNAPMAKKVSLDDLFSQIQEGEVKDLNIIVKADVQGSVEAVKQNLEKISNEEVRVRVIHGGVGAINESDIMLASTSNAIVVGFNVRPDPVAKGLAERNKVDMRMYRVIYECMEEIEAAMKGMLAPKFKEVELGRVEVRKVYKISNVGIVAGCYVTEGRVTRNAQLRLVRDGIVIHEGEIASLQRFKDSVKEVVAGYECGITLEKFTDIKPDDIFECFEMQEIER